MFLKTQKKKRIIGKRRMNERGEVALGLRRQLHL